MNPDSAKNATVTAPLAAVNLGVSEQSDVEHRMATSPLQSTGGVLGSREGGTTPATRMAIPAATGAMNRKTLPHQNRARSQPPTSRSPEPWMWSGNGGVCAHAAGCPNRLRAH